MADAPVKRSGPDAPGRTYRSTKRAERARKTRHAIREVATTLFLRDGYARTSMKAIASAAGVSEKTMYLTYDTKATLLRHVIEVAVRGDEDPAPLSQRPQWHTVLDGPAEDAFARFAALNADLMARTAPIIALAESAAASDPELAAYRDRAHETTRQDVRALVAALARARVLAPDIDERQAADTIFALAADESVYLRLTRECGWTDDRYASLIQRILQATIGTPQAARNEP